MLSGLQGSGKTTTAGKLARMFKQSGRKALLVAADIRRPAAVRQLCVLGENLKVQVYTPDGGKDAVTVCRDGVEYARMYGHDVVILDTAGRLHMDDELMEELVRIKDIVKPAEHLLVDNILNPYQLLHQFIINMETACCIEYHNIMTIHPCIFNTVTAYSHCILTTIRCVYLHLQVLSQNT